MKKFLSILVIALLAVFVSCSNDDNDNKTIYTVTFETDGGTPVPSVQSVEEGGKATHPSIDPVKAGFTFVFWHLKGSTTAYNFEAPVNGNIILAAQWEKESGLADIAAELNKDIKYSLFASALEGLPDESGDFTVFALPDNIIRIDADAMPVADIQWHVVRGKYTAEELLQVQTLQTVNEQTLTVVCEASEMDGEEQYLYINNVPLDYRSARMMGGSVVYPISTNIARISNVPSTDDLDAYNSWAARAIEGTWKIESVKRRKYHVWSISGREKEPFEEENDKTHIGCYEVFDRNPAMVAHGCAGTYKTLHRCDGEKLSYSSYNSHYEEDWWSVNAERIEFIHEVWAGGPITKTDWFTFNNGIGRIIKSVSGYGGDRYYGGDDDVIFDTYYEIEYALRKILN